MKEHRSRHLDSYFEWTHRHNGYMCLCCRKTSVGCSHNVPKMLICIEDEIPKLSASKSRWKKFFLSKRFIFTDRATLMPEEAYNIAFNTKLEE